MQMNFFFCQNNPQFTSFGIRYQTYSPSCIQAPFLLFLIMPNFTSDSRNFTITEY